MKYLLIPFLGWILSGCLKFVINYVKFGKTGAKSRLGYGGFPSTHTAITSSVVFLIGLSNGFQTPIFSLGLGMLIIIVIDAHGMRRKMGQYAKALNKLQTEEVLRERMGHTWIEIFGGIIVGFLIAFITNIFYG